MALAYIVLAVGIVWVWIGMVNNAFKNNSSGAKTSVLTYSTQVGGGELRGTETVVDLRIGITSTPIYGHGWEGKLFVPAIFKNYPDRWPVIIGSDGKGLPVQLK